VAPTSRSRPGTGTRAETGRPRTGARSFHRDHPSGGPGEGSGGIVGTGALAQLARTEQPSLAERWQNGTRDRIAEILDQGTSELEKTRGRGSTVVGTIACAGDRAAARV